MSKATQKIPLTKCSLIWLATSFLIGIASQSAGAFTITPSRGLFGWNNGASIRYLPKKKYSDDKFDVETWLDPKLVKEIKRGGTRDFLRTLKESFTEEDGWLFISTDNDLEGRFDIEYYYACALTVCGDDLISPKSGYATPVEGGVGAGFRLRYYPAGGDPDLNTSALHWIQRFTSITKDGFRDEIDTGEYHRATPFYDITGDATKIIFQDRPYQNIWHNIIWDAELYLAEVKEPANAPKTVTIYNGIQWGWKSKAKFRRQEPVPELAPVDEKEEEIIEPVPAPACPSGYEPGLAGTDGGGVVVSDRGENNCIVSKKFSDSLSSGREEDNFYLDGLTPGATFYAWINNDLASNQCNPNTYLSGYNDDGYFLGGDDNSSRLGDGFGSAVWGTVSSNGAINLGVKAANGGARGEDEGNYELYVNVFGSEDFPLETDSGDSDTGDIINGGSGGGGIAVGGSGGGGVVTNPIIIGASGGGGIEPDTPGRSQQNPLFPDSIDNEGWQTFNNVPGCRWYDPPIANTFEFVATDNTLFTEILDFPRGEDNLFTVVVDDMILGEYSPGDRVDFVSLLGRGISNFKITDIDYLVGSTEETYFPIQLAFDKNVGSFKMRMVEEEPKKKVPESNSIWGLIALGAFGLWKIRGWKNRK